ARAPRANRDAPRALLALGRSSRAGGHLLTRDDPAARALQGSPPRARVDRPRRALFGSRRRRRGTPRSRARGAGRRAHARPRDSRSRPSRPAGDGDPGTRVTYLADVAALTRKDLRVELRGRDTLPAI